MPRALDALDEVLDRAAEDYAEKLAPAIDRVWRDEVDESTAIWHTGLQKLVDAGPGAAIA